MNLAKEKTIDLVKACAKGEEDALRDFFEIYSQDIYNFPLKVFHMTEDDASDFFLYAFERLKSGKRFHSFQGKSSFRTWFYTVLRNMLIDWKRTKKELRMVDSVKFNSSGMEYSTIENEPDELSNLKESARAFTEKFYYALSDIKLESRVTFKLAYIYYLNLNDDEIQFILDKTGMEVEELKEKILEIRSDLSDKEEERIKSEDKITSLYMNILDLKEAHKKEKVYHFQDNLPVEDKIELSLKKKYEQRRKLLEKRDKGHFLTRTPYKIISNLLQIPEGSVSIALQRVIEKVKKKLS
ncbi:MAG: sigma-70 family RNA polymerase sigma factor [Leptospiraceae bacterium]|nr:sigma-70 family RNA polymerase sigma factor [Leptospiraceae bacterium]MCP5499918.1 sigma-70 family RNA polymerase sigma factor [Leptospiraceae bacterium]